MPRPTLAAIAAAALLLALAPAAPARTKSVTWQQNAGVAERVWAHVGHIPINGIQPPGSPPQRVKAGRVTYRVGWANALYSRQTTRFMLKEIHRDARFPPVIRGAYTDTELRGKFKRRFQVLVDLARDADVLVVTRDHPACEGGLTAKQARGIARGEIRDWGAAGAPGAGAIKRRLLGERNFAQPRFGAQLKPGRGIVRADGGVSEVAGGDRSVAAVTAWSRVRFNGGVCAVPIDGVRPTDETVFKLGYGPAHPVQYVMHRKRRKDREGRALVRAYTGFLKSAKATEMFRATGLLMVADGVPSGSGGGASGGGGPGGSFRPAPTTDHAERPITTTRDDEGARAAMSGRRFQAGSTRLVFDGDGRFGELTLNDDGTCAGAVYATWAVLEAWSYPEHGGGWFARVRAIHSGHEELFEVFLPGDEPGTAYVNGGPWVDDPSLPGDCA